MKTNGCAVFFLSLFMQLVIIWPRWPQKYQTLEILIRVEFFMHFENTTFFDLVEFIYSMCKNC